MTTVKLNTQWFCIENYSSIPITNQQQNENKNKIPIPQHNFNAGNLPF